MSTPSNDLNISQAGYVVFDGVATFLGRTLQAGMGISISNSDGIAGNSIIAATGGGANIGSVNLQTGTSPVTPTAGAITFNGAVVAAGTNPVRTDGTGVSTMALEVQISQALAATDATRIGLSNFDSAAFDVDANGFVQLNGGGIATTSFDVQANTAPGTDPVVPTAAGVVTVNGAAVTNHSVVLETRSRAANAYNLEIQYSAAAASTDATKSGVAHFNSAQFTVDANGFVSTSGTGIGNTITGQSGGSLSPTAGNWNIFGATVAAGTTPVATSGSGSTLTTNVQISQALASTDATKIGLANFDSASFSVDANGFVTLKGGTEAIDSIGVDATSGTGTNPVLPTVGGLVTVNGALIAAGTNPIRTVSAVPNVYQIQVQTAQAIASTDATKVGLANFNSAQFSVDANGFVSSTASAGLTTAILVTTFTASGTWTKSTSPPAKYIEVFGWNSGGGGASGRKATSTTSGGGGGGSGGGGFYTCGPASVFDTTETVTIGGTSNGGAAQATNSTNGNPGSAVNISAFGNMQGQPPATAAVGGTTTIGSGGGVSFICFSLASPLTNTIPTGGLGSNTAGNGQVWSAGQIGYLSGTPGGGGAGYDAVSQRNGGAGLAFTKTDASTVIIAGGTGGSQSGTINGGDGNTPPTTGGILMGGTGGGGGGGPLLGVVAGNGGNGAIPGGGGGGGSGGINAVVSSGAGGTGARGQVIVIEHF